MKKIIAVALLICISLVLAWVYWNSDAGSEQQTDIRTQFSRWDAGEADDSGKTETMQALANYICTSPQPTVSDIEALSSFISVIEADGLSVIQYIENPEFYGASGRESYHLAVHGDQAIMMGSKGSMRVEAVKKREENLYYVFATDYRVSAITGIRIFAIEVDGDAIIQQSLIRIGELADPFVYDDMADILYYPDGHIYFKEISDSGGEVWITAGDADYRISLDAPDANMQAEPGVNHVRAASPDAAIA